MSNTKKDQKEDSEEPQLSAQETLVRIISSLEALPKIEIKLPESIEFPDNENDESEETPKVECILCKKQIDKASFFVSLKCCGKFVHVQCMTQFAQNAGSDVPVCPNCQAIFTRSQIEICRKITSLIKS